ncbi:ATP-binding cassette domain-containing protein [Gorillibacterium sp. sgz5001074]|uniref:ATP-binding cassette domain-containing protein n=1 Tax=Gorillibacterium sp. sgz5001074 TaxID=3446695 RepID=UPI003F66C93C
MDVYLPDREKPLLEGLSMEVQSGEWLAVAGRNGSGKSVLGKLLAGLEGRYTGTILRAPMGETKQVRWVMQNPEAQLIGETVLEDVRFGLENRGCSPEQCRSDAEYALSLSGLNGLEDKPVRQLSGGQKQLLALAGAIAMKPAVLIADEITSMLDPASRARIMSVLHDLKQEGTAVVMITQLLEETVHCDRIIALDQGRIGYDGTPSGFYYEGTGGDPAACERMGMLPPYTVRLAKELQKRGIRIQGDPMTPEEWERAVM